MKYALMIVAILALWLIAGAIAPRVDASCTTDDECGCTTDCLDAAK